LSTKETNQDYILIAYFLILIFWILDGYFLSQERLFRDLYNQVKMRGRVQRIVDELLTK